MIKATEEHKVYLSFTLAIILGIALFIVEDVDLILSLACAMIFFTASYFGYLTWMLISGFIVFMLNILSSEIEKLLYVISTNKAGQAGEYFFSLGLAKQFILIFLLLYMLLVISLIFKAR